MARLARGIPARALLGLALLAGANTLWARPGAPTFHSVTSVTLGTLVAGSSAGTLTLQPSSPPTGVRSVSGGTTLGSTSTFALGSFYLSGTAGDSWTVQTATGNFTLSNGSSTLTVPYSQVVFSCQGTTGSTASGVFPGYFGTGSSATIYVGLTVQVGSSASAPPGTYTGAGFTLTATDTFSSRSTTNSAISVTATVEKAIGITKNSNGDLAFGALYGGPGTVLMSPAGVRTPSGGVSLFNALTFGAASFAVSGNPNATYTITLPSSRLTLTGPGSGVYVDTFTSSPSPTGTLDGTGAQTLKVGATLHVPTGPTPGTYSAAFTVTLAYN